ncbi:MAG: GNAT family N-acetyltransferase [Flavobacteriales bacterium TMED113]|nr:MAG: GNAT family N-acetyltransferase [Flavobacteriales bacterium TMED113]
MDIKIRKGIKKDLAEVLKLIKELAKYEKAEKEVIISVKDLENDGFGIHPYFWFLIAEIDNEIIGLSFYFIRYSTWKGKFLYLEDLVIKEKYRKKGVGSLLFEKTIKVCDELNCNGMSWQVLDWNKPAINFYKKYNAKISSTWLNGKLTKEQLQEINSK